MTPPSHGGDREFNSLPAHIYKIQLIISRSEMTQVLPVSFETSGSWSSGMTSA